jgi:uncharacterized protein
MGRLQRLPILQVRCPTGTELALAVANRPGARLAGLAGLAGLGLREGLLIPRCRSVHTVGMRFAIDVVFVKQSRGALVVLAVHGHVPAWRVVRHGPRLRGIATVELASGTAEAVIVPGASLELVGESNNGS